MARSDYQVTSTSLTTSPEMLKFCEN